MAHSLLQNAMELMALAEEIGDEKDIAEANAELDRVLAKLDWTLRHANCDHAYGICQEGP